MAIEPHHSNKALQELIDKLSEQSGNSNHENLQGLLGGNASGHYHMTAEQLQQLQNILNGNNNHELLNGLLGGNASGHHHLTLDELNKLKGYPNFNSLNHESLQGLLGGNSNGHYHLTVDLLNKLINLPANGGGGSGSDVKYRIVKIPYVTDAQFTVPDGVTSVCISGCAGGAGLRYSKDIYERTDKAVVYWGYSGEQCIGFILSVNPHDTFTISVGSGGFGNPISAGRNIADGKDSIVYLNGAEILKLRGGYAGDETIPSCPGYNSGGEFIPPAIKYESTAGLLLGQWLYGSGDNELVSRICSLFSIMNPVPTFFPPYGMAAYDFSHNLGAGVSGLIIIEYIETVK